MTDKPRRQFIYWDELASLLDSISLERKQEFSSKDTSKSTLLSGPASPRACDPNNRIFLA